MVVCLVYKGKLIDCVCAPLDVFISLALAEYACVMHILLLSVYGECIGDYYSVLGIPRSASEKEIQRAFLQLALKLHPEKNHSPNAQQLFIHFAQAYEVLSDQEKQRLYDQEKHWDQCSKRKGKQALTCSLQKYNYSYNDFLTFSLEDLLEVLQMEEDEFMAVFDML
ncbi:hypothetical protein P4O66_009628 [Electrophorus voltai]|uniref:DnaJ homolog subfamily B member 9 n=2 Tax=Electrophorus TaxID=8004 RepID=A0AAD8ZCM6_9TELE|nr:hypothetical protein P4O66_009628 [Electrophorus voltai]